MSGADNLSSPGVQKPKSSSRPQVHQHPGLFEGGGLLSHLVGQLAPGEFDVAGGWRRGPTDGLCRSRYHSGPAASARMSIYIAGLSARWQRVDWEPVHTFTSLEAEFRALPWSDFRASSSPSARSLG